MPFNPLIEGGKILIRIEGKREGHGAILREQQESYERVLRQLWRLSFFGVFQLAQ